MNPIQLPLPGMEPDKSSAEEDNDRFWRLSSDCAAMFSVKNKQYGGAFHKGGLYGCVAELWGAASRMVPMVLQSDDTGRSQVRKLRDILMDVHNYATMALMCIEEDNWKGK